MKRVLNGVFFTLFLIIGALFFLLQHRYIIIIKKHTAQDVSNEISQKKITLSIFKDEKIITEAYTINCTDTREWSAQQALAAMIKAQQNASLINPHTQVQDIAFSTAHKTVFISFSEPLFLEQDPLFKKALVLKSIALALQSVSETTTLFHLFVNHQPMRDTHLLCTDPFSVAHYVAL